MSKIYCDTLTERLNKESFNGVKLYHGFNAFNTPKPWDYKFNTLKNNPQRQICTSTKYLGYMGVIVEGDILMASSYDLFSAVEEGTNRRYFDDKHMDYIVYDYKDLLHHEDDEDENNEIVVTNVVIKAIWVTEDAPNKLKQIAKELAAENNIPVVQVGPCIFC